MPGLFLAIEESVAPFLDSRQRARLHGELEFEFAAASARARVSRDAVVLEIQGEWDICLARNRAREMVRELQGTSQKVVDAMTLVSELARNIVLYAAPGRIALIPRDTPAALLVRAEDHGPGIPHLSDVLGCRYRSKTGLGRGILGARALSYRFEIDARGPGTRIEAEVRL